MSYATKEVLSWPNSRDDTRFAAAPNKLKTRSLSAIPAACAWTKQRLSVPLRSTVRGAAASVTPKRAIFSAAALQKEVSYSYQQYRCWLDCTGICNPAFGK